MCVSSWHCHSMKSLSRVTPLVRTKMSRGGSSRVYVWLSIVSAVIVSGFGYRAAADDNDNDNDDDNDDDAAAAAAAAGRESGESGSSSSAVVADDIEDSSASDLAVGSGDGSRLGGGEESRFSWLDRIFCEILVCENGPLGERDGVVYSSTVALIALVISALDVYGKHIFSTALNDHVNNDKYDKYNNKSDNGNDNRPKPDPLEETLTRYYASSSRWPGLRAVVHRPG